MLLGTEFERPDAEAKARGLATYTEDLYPPGLLYCAVLRSPVASARLRAIATEAAERFPGVARVLTAADLPDRRWGTVERDQPILARDVVRFAGEPIAIVVAEEPEVAAAAVALIGLELDPLPAVVRLQDAIAPDAVEVQAGRPNTGRMARIRRGDVDAVLAEAPVVVRTQIESHRVHQGYIEPRATLAEPDGQGGLRVTTTSQAPFVVRQGLAALLDLPLARVAVRVPALGGGFGGKLHLGLAPLAAVACLATGCPVQVVAPRSEDMQAGNPRENSLVELVSGVDEEGRLLARRTTVHLDSGAYAFDTPMIASIAALQGTGPYHVPAVDLVAVPVLTNTCPTGSFRGPSGPQMVYAIEHHMEEIAAVTSCSPVGLRRRNILRSGGRGPSGEPLPDVGMEDALEAVAEHLEAWRGEAPAEGGRRRGYGLASAWWLTTGSPSAATATMDEDGGITIHTGGTEIGTGAVLSGVAAIAADALGVGLDDVRIVSADTAATPHDAGSKGSRTLYGVGNAVQEAVAEVVAELAEEGAEQLEASPNDLVFADGSVAVRGDPHSAVPLATVVQGALNRNGPVVGKGRFRGGAIPLEGSQLEGLYFDAFNEPTFHCHGVEIELDEETGVIAVLRYVAAHDVGAVLNPGGARGQVEGGVVQGLGYALSEVMDVGADGIVRNADLVDYRLPTIADVPREMETVLIDAHPAPTGPHGAKGVGEAPVILPAAAIGSALRDLLDAQPDVLPLDPTRVCEFMDRLAEQRAASSAKPRR